MTEERAPAGAGDPLVPATSLGRGVLSPWIHRAVRIDLATPVAHEAPPETLVETLLREGVVGSADPAFAQRFGCGTSRRVEGRPVAELEGFWMIVAPERLSDVASRRSDEHEFTITDTLGNGSPRTTIVRVVSEIDEDGLHALWCLERDVLEGEPAQPPSGAAPDGGVETDAERHGALARAARLTVLGEMTAGIAHELNQPLGAIVNYANGCLRRLEHHGFEDDNLIDALHSIVDQGRRAAEIISRMRTFARRGGGKRDPRSLSHLLGEAVEFTASQIRRAGIRVESRFDADPDHVVVDSGQIGQVAIHLLRNAVDAVESLPADRPRRIRVETRVVKGPCARPMIEAAVIDSGNGVSEHDVPRLFEPFYTTRSGGLGLGLTASRAIVESHGGQLRLDPSPDADWHGTCFRFTLPLRNVPTPS